MTMIGAKVLQKEELTKEKINSAIQKGIDKFCKDYHEEDKYQYEIIEISNDIIEVDFSLEIEDEIEEYYYWVKRQEATHKYKVYERLTIELDENEDLEEKLESIFGATELFIFDLNQKY
ncbi:hypothetical protein ETU10_08385 [Apibacter muscae]|uniref:hypothetical protein n=1 Tax=Apibacter muscae TaxID=2509004 RepID=UPI0011ACBCB2|nr:hypothetical protein [Apibacter muscae]TWP23103.1 hypothetical protein ETU10_08385 [Apibacter muscae]